MNKERIQTQIKITGEADAAIESLMRQLGMTKVELLSRVCIWFGSQNGTIQKAILGLIDEELMPAAREVMLRELVNDRKGINFGDFLRTMRYAGPSTVKEIEKRTGLKGDDIAFVEDVEGIDRDFNFVYEKLAKFYGLSMEELLRAWRNYEKGQGLPTVPSATGKGPAPDDIQDEIDRRKGKGKTGQGS